MVNCVAIVWLTLFFLILSTRKFTNAVGVATETMLTIVDEYGYDDAELIKVGSTLKLSCRFNKTFLDQLASAKEQTLLLDWCYQHVNETTVWTVVQTHSHPLLDSWYNLTLRVTLSTAIFGFYQCVLNGKRIGNRPTPITYRLCTLSELGQVKPKNRTSHVHHRCIYSAHLDNITSMNEVKENSIHQFCPRLKYRHTCSLKSNTPLPPDLENNCDSLYSNRRPFLRFNDSNACKADGEKYKLQVKNKTTGLFHFFDEGRVLANENISLIYTFPPGVAYEVSVHYWGQKDALVVSRADDKGQSITYRIELITYQKARVSLKTKQTGMTATFYLYRSAPHLSAFISVEYNCKLGHRWTTKVVCKSNFFEEPLSDYVHDIRIWLFCTGGRAESTRSSHILIAEMQDNAGSCSCRVNATCLSTPIDMNGVETVATSSVVTIDYNQLEGCQSTIFVLVVMGFIMVMCAILAVFTICYARKRIRRRRIANSTKMSSYVNQSKIQQKSRLQPGGDSMTKFASKISQSQTGVGSMAKFTTNLNQSQLGSGSAAAFNNSQSIAPKYLIEAPKSVKKTLKKHKVINMKIVKKKTMRR